MTASPRFAMESASGRPTRPRPTTATFSMSRSLGAAALGNILPGERQDETRIGVEVSRQQAPGLLGDPVDPLETALLHPARRHRDATGVEVESGAHAADHRYVEPLAHAGHPLLLLRYADADPQHVRPSVVDLCRQRAFLVVGERPEWRRVPANDLDAGVAAPHRKRQLGERALVP